MVSTVMQNDSHERTWVALILDELEDWRREIGASRESLAILIVEAHERIGGHQVSRITFERQGDAYQLAKNSADRIYRWLDEVTKDKNPLPANFVRVILAALPDARRMRLADELMATIGLAAVPRDDADHNDDGRDVHTVVVEHLQVVVAHSADAQVAMSQMLSGIAPGEPERARKKVALAIAALKRAGGFLGRIVKRKGKKA